MHLILLLASLRGYEQKTPHSLMRDLPHRFPPHLLEYKIRHRHRPRSRFPEHGLLLPKPQHILRLVVTHVSTPEISEILCDPGLILENSPANRHHKVRELTFAPSPLVTDHLRIEASVATTVSSEPPPTLLALRLCLPFSVKKPEPSRVSTCC